ncbi:hypothetical protein [Streptomyces sp. enrichment culture]|uniref:hypothetical protein n=1 Tax=Streptomyces sp. enrichment culture TaxID=1795815 RepID=UPI003F570D7A
MREGGRAGRTVADGAAEGVDEQTTGPARAGEAVQSPESRGHVGGRRLAERLPHDVRLGREGDPVERWFEAGAGTEEGPDHRGSRRRTGVAELREGTGDGAWSDRVGVPERPAAQFERSLFHHNSITRAS